MAAAQPAAPALTERYERRLIEDFLESPFNPRKTFNDVRLQELADSIRAKGVVEPLVARTWSKHTDKLEIVCGARRYRAGKLAGVADLPVIIRSYTDAQVVEIMAIENGQRDDVPPLEEAAGYKQLLLIDKTYTPTMIAEKIGRTLRYVWDRLRLLELTPEIQDLLVSGEIGVDHAEIIAKLKPSEQKALLVKHGYRQECGLFRFAGGLAFEDDPTKTKQRKVVSVRELKQHIAEHVRLDIKHAAAAAPLDFGDTAKRVELAEAQPGRGKKVVPITFSHYCPDGAKDQDERTYGSTAWKRAEGKDGKPTCEHAKLGVVVAGEHYGESFHVCIARDRCTTHWKAEVAARQKAAKLRESGKAKQAAKVEKKQEDNARSKWDREQEERRVRERAWNAIAPAVIGDAAAQVKQVKALTAAQAKALENAGGELGFQEIKQHLGATWFRTPAAALLVSAVTYFSYNSWQGGKKESGYDQFVREIAKPFGLDLKRLNAVRDKHQPKPDAPAKKAS